MSLCRGVIAVAAGLAACVCAVPLQDAGADSPPPSWQNERILDCGGGMRVDAFLTPAGFGSAFHVVGSSDVIKPKHVEVVFPGTTAPVTTYDVPGFTRNAAGTVHCTYTDPAGLYVDFYGLRV